MNILFLGYVVEEKNANTLSGVSIAGNNMQLNIIKELSKYKEVSLSLMTVYPVASFPKDKKLHYRTCNIKIDTNISSLRVGFLNIVIFKQLCQMILLIKYGFKYLRKNPNSIIFTYNMFPQVGIPSLVLKKVFKVKLFSLLADFPIDDKMNRNIISMNLRRIFDKLTFDCIKQVDKAIILNKYAAELFLISKKYLVIEGGVNSNKNILNTFEKYDNFVIVFTGALTEYNGIRNLISAFKILDNDSIELHIYGSGDLEKYIIMESTNNRNIKYYGKVSSEVIFDIQRKAHLLINPRDTNDLISKVTFPSKILEYMSTGTPILTSDLNCLINEYKDYMFFYSNNSIYELANKINEIYLMPRENLINLGMKAKQFVFENKSWKIQVKRIFEFLSS